MLRNEIGKFVSGGPEFDSLATRYFETTDFWVGVEQPHTRWLTYNGSVGRQEPCQTNFGDAGGTCSL